MRCLYLLIQGLRFADFGAGLRQLFNRGLQGGTVFYVEDTNGAIDLAEQAGQDFAGAYFYEDGYAGIDHVAHGFQPADWIGDLADERVAGLFACGDNFGVHVRNQWEFQVVELRGTQVRFEALLRGHHHGAMKGRGNGQDDGTFCAALRGDLDGALYRGGGTGDDCLFRRIHVGGRDDFSFRGFFADFGDVRGR